MFRGLAPDARHMTLEVQDVTVMEPSEDLVLAVGHDGPFTLGGRAAHATVTRALDRRGGGNVIEVAVTPGEWQTDHRLLYPGHVFLDDRRLGHSMSMAVGRPVTLSCADPTGAATAVTVASSLVHVRGPWELEIPAA